MAGAILESILRDFRTAVDHGGALTEEGVKKLAARFGDKPDSLSLSLDEPRQKQEAETDDPDGKPR